MLCLCTKNSCLVFRNVFFRNNVFRNTTHSLELSLSNYKSHLVSLKSSRGHHGLEPLRLHCLGPFQPPGMEKMGQRAISTMQLFPAVTRRFLAQGHAGSLCRSSQWAQDRRGSCFQPAAPLALHGKGWCAWGDLAEGSCFRLWLCQMS